MIKLMSKGDLEERRDLMQSDRELIEGIIHNLIGDEDTEGVRAIRGYLVCQIDESDIDDNLRSELGGDAAAFSDGWMTAKAQKEDSLKPKVELPACRPERVKELLWEWVDCHGELSCEAVETELKYLYHEQEAELNRQQLASGN